MSLKVYVAGPSEKLDEIDHWIHKVRHAGLTVAHDWVKIIRARGEANPREADERDCRSWAEQDLSGVKSADVFWLLCYGNNSFGSALEFGVATSLNKHTVISGHNQSIFSSLAKHRFNTHDEALTFIANAHWPIETKSEFVKYDAEKPRIALVDPEYILGTADVLTFGARKYGDYNWQKCTTPFDTYYSAIQRHLLERANGIKTDADSGRRITSHISCNAMFLDWFDRQ